YSSFLSPFLIFFLWWIGNVSPWGSFRAGGQAGDRHEQGIAITICRQMRYSWGFSREVSSRSIRNSRNAIRSDSPAILSSAYLGLGEDQLGKGLSASPQAAASPLRCSDRATA